MNEKMPAVAALVLGPLAGAATADGGEGGGGAPPLHGHMLILGVEYGPHGDPVGFRKCVDLANNKPLKLNAHHSSVHTGNAGQALMKAGHMVAPTDPHWPGVYDCATLVALFESGGL